MHQITAGLYQIDTGYLRPDLAACYLLVDQGQAALIETGTSYTLPRVEAALARLGLDDSALRYVIPTHVHLDHAGGAGALLARYPQAQLVVHPLGARHLIDPAKLIQGAQVVYGEERFAQLYGDIVPVDAERVITPGEGDTLMVGGRRLQFWDTPGHARHHFCVWDERSRGCFTGDTLGIGYPELIGESGRLLIPSTTPVQFDPDALRASIEKVLALQPDRFYLTHMGVLEAPESCCVMLLAQLQSYVDLAHQFTDEDALRQALQTLTLAQARALAIPLTDARILELLGMDLELNAQGLRVWHERGGRG